MSEAEFQELFGTLSPRIHRLLSGMVGNKAVAEELCQESFLKAWRGLSLFQAKSSVSTWVYQVAVNTGRDWLRTHAHRGVLEVPSSEEPIEQRKLIQEALMELEDDVRTLLVLHYYEGFEIKELAGILKIPEGTVKSRLFSAKAKLKAILVTRGCEV